MKKDKSIGIVNPLVFRKEKGITLIALVVTIIVLLILAAVTISLVVGQNGIITRAREAKEKTEEAARQEQQGLAGLDSQINDLLEGNTFHEDKKVNVPKLVDGMTPIKFIEPTESTMGSVETTTTSDKRGMITIVVNGQIARQKMEVCGYGSQDMRIR